MRRDSPMKLYYRNAGIAGGGPIPGRSAQNRYTALEYAVYIYES